MKSLLRIAAINIFSLLILSILIKGFAVKGGFTTFLIGGAFLTVMGVILKPVLNLVSLPFSLFTMGLSSVLINVVILYLLTALVPGVSVGSFTFEGFKYAGFVFPKIYLNSFFAFVLSASLLSLIVSSLNWIRQ